MSSPLEVAEPDIDVELGLETDSPWIVLVWNDPINLMSYVTFVFQKLFGYSEKKANELGLFDMSGNVWEWCQNWLGPYSSGAQTDPNGAASGSRRVFRGSSWDYDAVGCRSANRGGNAPSYRNYYLGFRLVRSHIR